MKETKMLGAVTIIMAVFASCTNNDFSDLKDGEKVSLIGKTVSMPVTRTQIDGNAQDGHTHILWSTGDKLGVFGSTTVNTVFTGTHTEPVETSEFTGMMETGDTPQYAYYPYREDAADLHAVPVNVGEQAYTDFTSISEVDVKVGTFVSETDGKRRFLFQPMLAFLRIEVDINGMKGVATTEKLRSIHLEEPENSDDDYEPWGGGFTMDLANPGKGLVPTDGEAFTGIAVTLPNEPILTGKVVVYAALAPALKTGQVLQIYLTTDKHWIGFKVTMQRDLMAGRCYDVPLHLAHIQPENELTVEELPAEGGLLEAGALQNFSFGISDNAGKLLANEAYYNGNKTTTHRVTTKKLTITEGGESGEVNGCIPYLYDFKLKPTFTVTDGLKVYVNGTEQTSGVSEQDFSSPVTYTVKDMEGNTRDYVVTLTNTGLPVVVLTSDGTGGMPFLHTNVPLKTTDFVETHKIAIYDVLHPENNLAEAACGFRIRGNSTSNFPKKPLAVKLAKKASVLGMPKHKRWCLLASWIDRSLIRNGVAFDIANKTSDAFAATENKGIGWNPHGKNVELVLNGVHVGSYYLCEQIKIDENRVAVQDGFEDQTAPTTDNCGYLLEFDDNYDEPNKMHTSYCNLPLMSKDVITDNTIWNYISGWVQDIENKLWSGNYTAAYEKLDINSVADYWIVQELTMNNEYRHPKSVYMVKDGAGKLCAGPVWDFDYQTFPNIAEINKINKGFGKPSLGFDINTQLYTKYSYKGGYDGDAPYMWYPLLMKDANFKARVKQRWMTLYPVLQGVTATIDRLGGECKLSDKYNQEIWPIESKERTGYSWYIDYSGDERMEYDALIENFKTVYLARLNAMNSFISKW